MRSQAGPAMSHFPYRKAGCSPGRGMLPASCAAAGTPALRSSASLAEFQGVQATGLGALRGFLERSAKVAGAS